MWWWTKILLDRNNFSSGKLLTYCFKQFVFNRLLPGMGNPSWQTSFAWVGPVAGDPHRVFCSLCTSTFKCVKGTSELKAHGDGRGHQAKEGNAASEIARGIRTKQGNIEGALRISEWSCCCSAEESKRWNFEGRSFTGNFDGNTQSSAWDDHFWRFSTIFDTFYHFLTI